ncbi:hypothetical protein [Kitasatospora sp. NPDC056531]|uniref:helix-hairpin-helix domain-containing protein n=1 Tax=Kitasatospora sp. NPDC056531 TaxID=3345856 RepID=UPI003673A99B
MYASAWLKYHYPAAFTCALLANQPMGFYSPLTLIQDARRHGATVLPADINHSQARPTLEPVVTPENGTGAAGQMAIRLGLAAVRGLGDEQAETIAAGQPYTDLEDFARRTDLPEPALEALATAGAFASLGLNRRQALWSAAPLARTPSAGMLPGTAPALAAPDLAPMTAVEETIADLWATGTSATSHPVQHARAHLKRCGALTADAFKTGAAPGTLVAVGGLVTHRQRPPTAGGVLFLSLEDETGLVNVICQPHIWERQRRAALQSAGLLVHGTAERRDGAVNLVAHPPRPAHPRPRRPQQGLPMTAARPRFGIRAGQRTPKPGDGPAERPIQSTPARSRGRHGRHHDNPRPQRPAPGRAYRGRRPHRAPASGDRGHARLRPAPRLPTVHA